MLETDDIYACFSNLRYIMILEQEYFILFQQSFKLICKFAST